MSMVSYQPNPPWVAAGAMAYKAYQHRGTIARAGRYIGKAFNGTLPSKKAGSRNSGGSNNMGKSSSVMTQYNDNKVTYRARKSKRGGKKYKKSFTAKTLKVMRNDAPSQQILWSDTNVVTNSNQGEQSMFLVAGLNTWYGDSSFPGDRDMYRISNTFAESTTQIGGNQTAGTLSGANTYEATSSKVIVKSSKMDIIMQSPTGSTPTIIDLYEAYCRKDIHGYPTPESALLQSDRSLQNQGLGGNTAMTRNAYGVTPFQLNQFTEQFKIIKKTRAILQPDQPLQYSMSDRKQKVLKGEYFRGNVANASQYLPCKSGWTKVLIAVAYKGPELVTGTAVVPAVGSVQFSITKMYNIKQVNSKPKTGTFIQL